MTDYRVSFETLGVPAENAALTQIATTTGTYRKAGATIESLGLDNQSVLDFGAGKGLGTKALSPNAESYEPFPGESFEPNHRTLPSKQYRTIVCLNVLNVLPPEERKATIQSLASVLRLGGTALIGTRGKDVANAKHKAPVAGDLGGFVIQPGTTRRRYQKGFTTTQLVEEVQSILGPGYRVTPVKVGSIPAAVRVDREPLPGYFTAEVVENEEELLV